MIARFWLWHAHYRIDRLVHWKPVAALVALWRTFR